jgi:hypothetical protein
MNPSAADWREINGMGSEKFKAFQESWVAMWCQTIRLQATLMQSVLLSMAAPPPTKAASVMRSTHTAGTAVTKIMIAGITPIHAKAVKNINRLARPRR